MEIDLITLSGWIVTATIGTIGLIKFKLIEEIVKKMTSNDSNAKGFSFLFLICIVIFFSVITLNLPTGTSESKDEQAVVELEPDPKPEKPVQKTELEIKKEIVEAGVNLTTDLVRQAKENKRKRDSIFLATREQRWVYRIGDWTDDEDKIIQTYKKLSMVDHVKVFKQKKKYLFIKEDNLPKEQLESSLDSLQSELLGVSINIMDLNTFLKNKRKELIVRPEKFGKGGNKITLDCLVVD